MFLRLVSWGLSTVRTHSERPTNVGFSRPLSQHHPRIVSFPRPGSGSRLPSSSPPRLSVPGKGLSAVHILQTCAQCSKNLRKEKTQDCCPPQELELKTAFRSPINLENRLS